MGGSFAPDYAFLKKKEIHDFEYYFKTRKNADKWLNLNAHIIYDPILKGKTVLAIVKDVTEHKKLENEYVKLKRIMENEKRGLLKVAKEVEEELDAECFILKEYFENMPLFAYYITFEGIIADLNMQAVKVLGYSSKDELIGKPYISTVYAPSSQKKVKMLYEKWKKACTLKNEELQIVTKQGKTIDVLLNIDTIFAHNGKPLYTLSTQRDITELKKTETMLRDSNERYHNRFENAPISLWEMDGSELKRYIDSLKNKGIRNFRTYFNEHPEDIYKCVSLIDVVEVNKATMKLFGEEGKGKKIRDLRNIFCEESYSTFREGLSELTGGKTMYEGETMVQLLHGKKIHVFLKWEIVSGSENTWSNLYASVIDITNRKHEEEIQKQNQVFLDSIVENIPIFVILKDAKDLRFELINKAGENLLGYKREDLIGRNDYDFFPKQQADFFINTDREVLRTGKLKDIPEEPINTKKG